MAVDTAERRFSMLGIGLGSILHVIPQGAIGKPGRATLMNLYSGITLAGVTPINVTWTNTKLVNGSDVGPENHMISRPTHVINISTGKHHCYWHGDQITGDEIYTKELDIESPSVSDLTDLGTEFIANSPDDFFSVGCPTHAITTAMGAVPIVCGNDDDDETWYNELGESSSGYIPIAGTNGKSSYSHTQNRPSGYEGSKWWTFLQIGNGTTGLFTIHEFTGKGSLTLGQTGGYNATSAVVTDSAAGRRLSTYFQNDTCWTFNMLSGASRPRFERFDLSGGTWTRNISTEIRPSSGTDGLGTTKTSFGENLTVQISMDQNDCPILVTVGDSVADGFGSTGIQIAVPVSAGSPGGTWQSGVLDAVPKHGDDVRQGAFQFTEDGTNKIGIIYANDTANKWYFIATNTTTTLSEYVDSDNWTSPVAISDSITVDDHCSVQSTTYKGAAIISAIVKDSDSAPWLLQGQIGDFTTGLLLTNRSIANYGGMRA